MGWIIAAAVGGFLFGGIVFVGIGVAWGYAKAVRHISALGTLVLQNAATAQAKQQPQPSSKRVAVSNLNEE
jgi:hypothetical protein